MVNSFLKQAEEEINYINANQKYSDKDRTKIIRDRVDDNMRSQMNGVHGAAIGAGVGLGLGLAQSKAIAKIYEKAKPTIDKSLKKGNLTPNAERILKMISNPTYRKGAKIIGLTGAAIKGAKVGYLPGRTLGDMAYLEKRSRKELGREPTEAEYRRVSEFSNDGNENPFAKKYLDSPSAIIQSNKRKKKLAKKHKIEKQASYIGTAKKTLKELPDKLKNMSASEKAILANTIGGSVVGGATLGGAVHKMSPEESKHHKLKTATGVLAGAATGGLLGNRYAKSISDTAKSISQLKKDSKDLKEMVEEEIAKRKATN